MPIEKVGNHGPWVSLVAKVGSYFFCLLPKKTITGTDHKAFDKGTTKTIVLANKNHHN